MENDTEYQVSNVRHVADGQDSGWTVTDEQGWSIFVPSHTCSERPKPGEMLRQYGRGIGHPVRGIVIGERVYRYSDREAHEREQAEMREKLKREREEAEAEFRASEKPKLATFSMSRRRHLCSVCDAARAPGGPCPECGFAEKETDR